MSASDEDHLPRPWKTPEHRVTRAEDLRSVASRLQAIVETAVDGIVTIDEHGTIETVNPATERLFGYRADEMVGRNVSMLMPQPYRAEHDGYLARYRRTGERHIIGIGREVRGRRKDGSEFPLDLAVSETNLPGRRFFTGIIRDISERKREEEELRKAKEEAEMANRAKDDFLAIISHELRTPLNAIIGYTDLIQDRIVGEVNGEQATFLRRIAASSRHLLELIEQVLMLTRDRALAVEPRLSSVNVGQLLSETAALVEPAAAVKGLDYTADVEGAAVLAELDESMMRQVVLNLLSNAVKFTPRGEVRLHAMIRNGDLRVDVRDTGVGIRPENLQHVFEPFYREDSTLTRQTGGTGLGLSVVRQLVEGPLRGRVTVRSEPGRGSTFSVVLPLRPREGGVGSGSRRPGSSRTWRSSR